MTNTQELIASLRSDANDHRRIATDADMNPVHTVNWQHALTADAAADHIEALSAEVERLTNNFKVNLNALHKAANERDQARAELAAIRAQEPDLNDLLQGKLVSMDVSTGEDDAYNRVFGRVCEVMLQSCGSEEDTILAIEESRNFASPTDKDAGLVADTRYQEIREALENLMAWQVKNVKVWNHPTWDNAQAVIDRHDASPKLGAV